MNKYIQFSRLAQKKRRQERMCENKKAYLSEEAAMQKGQRHYRCPHCHNWHRSGQFASLLNLVKQYG